LDAFSVALHSENLLVKKFEQQGLNVEKNKAATAFGKKRPVHTFLLFIPWSWFFNKLHLYNVVGNKSYS
jgi:hypothetical protein